MINREATPEEKFLAIAPFLRAVDSPKDRREQSRAFDERIASFIDGGDTAVLPQIHCFYEVMSETAKHAEPDRRDAIDAGGGASGAGVELCAGEA